MTHVDLCTHAVHVHIYVHTFYNAIMCLYTFTFQKAVLISKLKKFIYI